VAEFLEFADEAFGGAFGVAALVVVAAEFAVGLAGGEHVPVGDEDRVFDGAQQTAEDLLGLRRLRGAACACTPSLQPLLAR